MMRLTMTVALAALLMPGGQIASAGPLPADSPERPAVSAPRLLEPKLHLAGAAAGAPRVALTLDACGGAADERIITALVANNIPATVFVTGLWLKRNGKILEAMLARPDLFELEDHGDRHLPAVDFPDRIYGLRAAGSRDAVAREVEDGVADLVRAGGPAPHWFRGATARYSPGAVQLIRQLGLRVAGYSINADGGASLSAAATEHNVEKARNGDVLLAHVNQPARPAGAGLVRGLLALKTKGVIFVRLEDAGEVETPGV